MDSWTTHSTGANIFKNVALLYISHIEDKLLLIILYKFRIKREISLECHKWNFYTIKTYEVIAYKNFEIKSNESFNI